MTSSIRLGVAGFMLGLAAAGAGAQATAQHEHKAPEQPPVGTATQGMQGSPQAMMDMHAMMADPAMRKKMMENMAQCRDMMSMMMEHMAHEGMKKSEPSPH